MPRLQIEQLGKTYQDGKTALDDFNLGLDTGIFGLLGPNGAGKSTLLEILSLNLMPTQGRVTWEGRDIQVHPNAFRRVLGYLPQNYGFYGELMAWTLLEYLGKLHGLRGRRLRERIEAVLEVTGLTSAARHKTKSYSGGMRQRLAIAQALLHEPQLLVIDEPTTGLDPGERVAFRNLIFDLGRRCIVFLSTHIVKDVEFSCHGMTLLFGGRQHFTGRPVEFMEHVADRVFELDLSIGDFEAFAAGHQVVSIHEHGDRISVRFIAPDADDRPSGAVPARANLEDAYVDFIRLRMREQPALEESLVGAE